ncbi:hypothetical protein [Bacillus sp. CGMCC 1.16541]|uniref:hypothetical protein n=1 Tax=Bacillus sp. CGMCC 1.16541 TaxID=2185143 RepID=UPI000D739FEB|nr:hypothetical protein [Bacillus sp. CGMCC 1.16541]
MTYRPTVRYSEIYKNYVEDVFKGTNLDRNQIIRLALFVAAHSDEYRSILKKHKIGDVPLPYPEWGLEEEACWKEQNYTKKIRSDEKSEKEKVIKLVNQGGITIKLG